MSIAATITAGQAEADTEHWLKRAVIGLNLCPFAKAVLVKRQIHYAVHAAANDDAGLMEALMREAADLARCPPSERDTTLLIAPNTLADFLDFNDFTQRAERQLKGAGFDGELQLASFHPWFEFVGSAPHDIANATNRAPYPTLHLLREDSVSRAVDTFPEAGVIFERNIETLLTLGAEGWAALDVGPGGAGR